MSVRYLFVGRKVGTLCFRCCGISNISSKITHPVCFSKISFDTGSISYYSTVQPPPNSPQTNSEISKVFQDVNYEEIVGSDEELLKKLKVIMLEIEVMRQDGSKVPNHINTNRWKEILECKSRSQRIKLLSFLFISEKKRENDKRKKEIKRELGLINREKVREERANVEHLVYGVGQNTFLLRIYDSKIDQYNNQRVISAMLHGQKIVVDLSYDSYMTPKESANCAKQLTATFAVNRTHADPYDVHFCNSNPDSFLVKKLVGHIPRLYDPDFPINITEKSYLDIFPKDKLVYLTPHCREELVDYSHDDIYIIGGMVDKVNNDPLSLAKAKKEGLRMAKFPLDRYLTWYIGTKSLTINQVMSVMLDLKLTSDWKKALSHVPQRKLLQEHHLEDRPRKERNFHRHSNYYRQ